MTLGVAGSLSIVTTVLLISTAVYVALVASVYCVEVASVGFVGCDGMEIGEGERGCEKVGGRG